MLNEKENLFQMCYLIFSTENRILFLFLIKKLMVNVASVVAFNYGGQAVGPRSSCLRGVAVSVDVSGWLSDTEL